MEPEPAASPAVDPLAGALLPVLLHKLNNASQLLAGLNALLAVEGGEALVLERSDDLGEASRDVEDLGWLMAVLASAGGSDLLLERREPRGLAILVGVLRDVLRRQGVELLHSGDPPPRLAADVLDGWQVAWSLGALLHASAVDLAGGRALEWSVARDADGARISAGGGAAVAGVAPAVERRLPGARLALAGGRWTLALPAEWLLPEGAA